MVVDTGGGSEGSNAQTMATGERVCGDQARY